MAPESENNLPLEIGHVLFIDIVGYSKLLINEQSDLGQHLKDRYAPRSRCARPMRPGN